MLCPVSGGSAQRGLKATCHHLAGCHPGNMGCLQVQLGSRVYLLGLGSVGHFEQWRGRWAPFLDARHGQSVEGQWGATGGL